MSERRCHQPEPVVQQLCKPDPLSRWDFLIRDFDLFRVHRARLPSKHNGPSEQPQPDGPDQALGSANFNVSMQGSGGGHDQ
jgi:hypothetical protein